MTSNNYEWPWTLNGEQVSQLPLADRGLHYGDGLFETIPCINRSAILQEQHLRRLSSGLELLKMDSSASSVWSYFEQYLSTVEIPSRTLIKLLVTRGSAGRGYRPAESAPLTVAVRAFDWPGTAFPAFCEGIQTRLCDLRLGCNPALAGIKHLNRLEQVMAQLEWQDEKISEGLLRDTDGYIVEGTKSNLFFVKEGRLCTPLLDRCGVAGVMRNYLLDELLAKAGLCVEQGRYSWNDLAIATEVFMCNSLMGIVPVLSCEHLSWSPGPTTGQLQKLLEPLYEQGSRTA